MRSLCRTSSENLDVAAVSFAVSRRSNCVRLLCQKFLRELISPFPSRHDGPGASRQGLPDRPLPPEPISRSGPSAKALAWLPQDAVCATRSVADPDRPRQAGPRTCSPRMAADERHSWNAAQLGEELFRGIVSAPGRLRIVAGKHCRPSFQLAKTWNRVLGPVSSCIHADLAYEPLSARLLALSQRTTYRRLAESLDHARKSERAARVIVRLPRPGTQGRNRWGESSQRLSTRLPNLVVAPEATGRSGNGGSCRRGAREFGRMPWKEVADSAWRRPVEASVRGASCVCLGCTDEIDVHHRQQHSIYRASLTRTGIKRRPAPVGSLAREPPIRVP